jgi:uncharacterized membrane protein
MNAKQSSLPTIQKDKAKSTRRPFRTAVFRGFAALLPPLLTVLFLIWVINTTRYYILEPVTNVARDTLVWLTADIRYHPTGSDPAKETISIDGVEYQRLSNETYIPQNVYQTVQAAALSGPAPITGNDFYRRHVELKYLKPYFSIPIFLAFFILLLYLLGRLMTVGIGGFVVNFFEGGVRRLPLVRNVYSAAKQISDFFFSKHELEVKRIVAVEHPRKGMWTLGFVTNEGFPEIRDVVKDSVVTVLIPYSPLPVTGITITVRKSECIDLKITFDQACEYIVSCGVVIPQQRLEQLRSLPAALPAKK